MNGYVIETRCGLPYNKFDFFIDTGSGKAWYDVGSSDPDGYRNYISLDILYAFLYFYNGIDLCNVPSDVDVDDISEYFIKQYKIHNKSLSQKFDTIIDVGAHHGHYTLNFSKISKKVISIEPDAHNYNVLKRNLKINDIENVDIYKLFITNDSETRTFGYDDFFRFDNGLYEFNDDCKSAELDNFFNSITDNSLIKIDTNGEEIKVLLGSKKILNNCKCSFIVELYDFCRENHTLLPTIMDFEKYDIVKISRGKNYPEKYNDGDDYSTINQLFFRRKQ